MTARQSRIPAVVSALVAAAVLAAAPAARAHHSGAVFDLKQTVSLEGVVTRYEWANPHVYIWLAAPDASGETVEWEIEGQPPAILRRLGWSQDTLTVGDMLQATGNPARNPQRKSLLLASMQRAGTTLYDGKTIIGTLTTSGAAPAAAADGIAGVWVTLLDMAAMQSYLNLARSVPLTEHGAAAKADYDEATMSSGLTVQRDARARLHVRARHQANRARERRDPHRGRVWRRRAGDSLDGRGGRGSYERAAVAHAVGSGLLRRPLGRRDARRRDDGFRSALGRTRVHRAVELEEAARRAAHPRRGR